MRSLVLSLLISAVALSLGCSISNSSESISDSISSPSRSISRSSDSSSGSSRSDDDQKSTPEPESKADTASYRSDVSQLTMTFLDQGGELVAFRAAVTQLAEARGITNWEADPATARAIGAGARRAGLDEAEFESFAQHLLGSDSSRLDDLRIGYQPSTSASAPTPPDA